MLAAGLMKNFDQSSARQDEIASIPPVVKGRFSPEQLAKHARHGDSEEADSLLNNEASHHGENQNASKSYSNIATQNNADNNSDREKHYQDKEVYERRSETNSSCSSDAERNRILIS